MYAGLDYPIGPQGTGLGPRAFGAPQALDKINIAAKIGLNYSISLKIFARAYGARTAYVFDWL